MTTFVYMPIDSKIIPTDFDENFTRFIQIDTECSKIIIHLVIESRT